MKDEQLYGIKGELVDRGVWEWAIRRWMKTDLSGLDRIELGNDEIDAIIDAVIDCPAGESSFFIKSPLKEFEVILVDENYPGYSTKVVFKKTEFPKVKKTVTENREGRITYEPQIDIFITLNESGRTDLIANMGIWEFKGRDDKKSRGTMQKVMWLDDAFEPIYFGSEEAQERIMLMLRDIKYIYLGIQNAFIERPTLFIEATPVTKGNPIPHVNLAKDYRKVAIQKRIVINKVELPHFRNVTRVMKCPCWGVMGHWRTYKSGKCIWIEPYKKGKHRNTPGAYSPKQYVVP